MKIIKYTIIALCLLFSASAFSQSSQKREPQVDSVALWNEFLDSALRHTSINAFQNWLYKNATVEQYQEGKFVDLFNAYKQYQLQLFLKPKPQPKK